MADDKEAVDIVEDLLEKNYKLRLANQAVMLNDLNENMDIHREVSRAEYRNWFGALFQSNKPGDPVGDVNIDSPVNHYYPQPVAQKSSGGWLSKLIGPLIMATGIGGGLVGAAWIAKDVLSLALAERPNQSVIVNNPDVNVPDPKVPNFEDTDTVRRLKLIEEK